MIPFRIVWIGLTVVLLSAVFNAETETDQPVDADTCNADADGDDSEPCDGGESDPDVVLDHNEHVWTMPKSYDCEDERNARDCHYWANEANACEKNPGFMVFSCPKSCGFCHLKNPKIRCQRHPNAKPAVVEGDIDKMFERLLTDFPQYEPEVYSRSPWVVVLKNVYTDEECDQLVKIGGRHFRRSVDAGDMKGDGAQFEEVVSDARTSQTAWCVDNCWEDPLINGIAQKAENITLIPKENSEFFQVLKYEVGQYYVEHHDYIKGHLDLPIGPRVYTYFLYLNTPDKGGGTKFNKLGFTIPAQKGSVAIWPSVLNHDPYKKEYRTNHEAVPVQEGVKYGANMWLHMYNFHDPYKITCTG